KELDVAPVQVTSGTGEHREAVWAAGGSQLLIIRGVIDELRSEMIRVDPVAPGEAEVLRGPEHGAVGVRTGEGEDVWILATDLGSDGMDFVGTSPALYSARLSEDGLSDLQRLTDPETSSLTGTVFLIDGDGVLLSRANRGSTE